MPVLRAVRRVRYLARPCKPGATMLPLFVCSHIVRELEPEHMEAVSETAEMTIFLCSRLELCRFFLSLASGDSQRTVSPLTKTDIVQSVALASRDELL